MFNPDQAFVDCPACDADSRHVQHVKANRWACNACGHEFTGPASSVAGNGVAAPMTSRRRTREALGAMLGLLLAVTASAQTNPLNLPLANLGTVTAAGSWTFDWPDGAGGDLSYGPGAIGVSEDGKSVYLGCNLVTLGGVAKLTIPALGGMAKPTVPCSGVMRNDIDKVMKGYGTPGWSWDAGAKLIGGVLEQGGKVCVTAFGSYDANNQAVRSHWCGPDLAHLSGPYGGTVSPGLAKANMGVIPPEWRALLGGPAFSTAGYSSIISRASYGAAFSVFDPADVKADNFPMTMLLGCPHSVASCITYGTPTSNDYNGSELSGGAFIVPGTRTLVVIEREASGPTCYGYATRNQALHGTPYPTAAAPGPENVPWCYSLSDPLNEKGPKGYPYRLVAKLYDLAELVAVKNGTKKPWDLRQYATVDLPGSSASEVVAGGAYNPVTGEFYLLRYLGGGVNTVYVYSGFGAGAQPPPPPTVKNCDGTWGAWTRQANSESACNASGQRTFIESRLFTVTTSPDPGGLACPASPESRTSTEACNPPIVMETFSCWVTSVGATYADGDARRTIRCDTNGPTASLPNGTTFTVTVPKK